VQDQGFGLIKAIHLALINHFLKEIGPQEKSKKNENANNQEDEDEDYLLS
jgi:hypothetical protein